MGSEQFAYDFEQRIQAAIRGIKESKRISEPNKKTIFDFLENYKRCYKKNFGKELSLATISKACVRLKKIGEIVGQKNFKSIDTEKKMNKCLLNYIEENGYTPSTSKTMKIYVKLLWRHIRFGNPYHSENPKETKEIKLIAPEEPITEKDIMSDKQFLKLMSIERDLQYMAIFFLMRYSGLRESEVLSMKISSVKKDELGCQVEVVGKTGTRFARVFAHWQYLFDWLEKHPQKDDENAPLWIVPKKIYDQSPRKNILVESLTKHGDVKRTKARRKVIDIDFQPMDYDNLSHRWKKLQMLSRAVPNKMFSLHNLRKQNTVWCMMNGISMDVINLNQGRKPGSRASSRYHIWNDSKVVDNAYAKFVGKEESVTKDKTAPIVCSVCKTVNSPEKDYCSNCYRPLDIKKAMKLDKVKKFYEDLFYETVKKHGGVDKLLEDIE
jgi:integrase